MTAPDPDDAAVRLAAAVAEFADLHAEALADPGYAHDRCVPVTEQFVATCAAHGVDAVVVNGMKTGQAPEFPGVTLALQGHYAVLVEDLVYDWTARQFNPGAPVPQVTTMDTWQAAWPPLGTD